MYILALSKHNCQNNYGAFTAVPLNPPQDIDVCVAKFHLVVSDPPQTALTRDYPRLSEPIWV